MLKNVKGVTLTYFSKNQTCFQCECISNRCKHSYQTFSIFVKNRDRIIKEMRKKRIEVQIGTYALHMHEAFQNNKLVEIKGSMKNSLWCFQHALALPLYNDLTYELQQQVVKELKACL